MNIYTVRDRMIDYYVLPAFFADNDQQAMAMISMTVNGDSKDALAQTPHHFELWRLGRIENQTGNITQNKEFIAECAGFIRSRVRENTGGVTRADQTQAAERRHAGETNGVEGIRDPKDRPIQEATPGDRGKTEAQPLGS